MKPREAHITYKKEQNNQFHSFSFAETFFVCLFVCNTHDLSDFNNKIRFKCIHSTEQSKYLQHN